METALAETVASRFDVQFRPVVWPSGVTDEAKQVIYPESTYDWFDSEELTNRVQQLIDKRIKSATASFTPKQLASPAFEGYDKIGITCSECGKWKWKTPWNLYDPYGDLPPSPIIPASEDRPIIRSRECFGDHGVVRYQTLMVRELAELLAKASPRDCYVFDGWKIRYV
ncbi:MAG: hypothetical protein LBJ43_04130, partial [Propionibacteriaceae bacterium]|jgi:hypothetical protein|nr:hypothetical protein [Propionibacteriaceae bacterium]